MTTNDPTIVAFAAHAQNVMALMGSGHLDRHQALANLVSDALAASVADGVDPDTADELLLMATTWAVVRFRGLAGDVLIAETPVPDDLADLDPGEAP